VSHHVTQSTEETLALGLALAKQLTPGDSVLLRGDLGAGKSVLARGIAAGLGVAESVTSPTFTIMNAYLGRCPVYHFDLYRIDNPDELYALGLDEYLDGDGVSIVEWPGNAELPPLRGYDINIEVSPDGVRLITVEAMG